MGPPGSPEYISHELEEFYFIPRLEEELYYYHTNPIENPIDELSQEEEEKQLTKEITIFLIVCLKGFPNGKIGNSLF